MSEAQDPFDLQAFLSELRLRGIGLRAEGDALRIRAPKGALSPEIQARLTERKTEVLSFLRLAAPVAPAMTLTPDPANRFEPFPLTDIQHAYWLGRGGTFELGEVSTHGYCELEGRGLSAERLSAAWQRLIERHDMLRTIILQDGRQRVLERPPRYELPLLDLRGQPAAAVDEAIERLRVEMAHQVLPADRFPLFDIRATLLDGDRVRLHLSLDALIADVFSMKLLLREWSWLHAHPEAVLPPLQISFRDYVLAEQSLRGSATYAAAKSYWMDRLDTLPPGPELPLATSPGALSRPRFVRRAAVLPPVSWQALRRRAGKAGVTPSGVLLAAFAEVLAAWSKSPRFTLNLTLFNRLPLHPQIDAIVGDFTSLVLLAVDRSSRDSFEALAQRVSQKLTRDLDHRAMSGVEVLRELRRRREPSGQVLMPVVFTSTLALGSVEASAPEDSPLGEVVYAVGQTPQVWLDHQVVVRGDGALLLTWDAVEELFPVGLLDAMFTAYEGLVQRLADLEEAWTEPRRRLVPDAQMAERRAINETRSPLADALLHELFAAQVQVRGSMPAVITAERTLSYAELASAARKTARSLRALGARPNTLVAVVMEKGWEQIAAVLGVLMAGAAYLPIEPGWPEARRHHLLARAEAKLVLTQPGLALSWPTGVEVLTLDESGPDPGPLDSIQSGSDLAYVIFTSGSTGEPKGVMIDHCGAVNTILDINRRFAASATDRVLALSSLSFDLSVYDIFGLLAAGGAVVVPCAADSRDPAAWARLMQEAHVTIWNTVPALMQMLVEAQHIAIPDSLRLALLSGDWIPLGLIPAIEARCARTRIVSLGGATEASIWSIVHPIETVKPGWKSVPYGRPLTNQRFHVLDEALLPRPVLVPGELYIGGNGLARGYWRDEDKTRQSFFVHPQTGERLYRTGDLGCYLPGGEIEFLGREDSQVKINGYRIELGEIEATLAEHPGLREAVIDAAGDPGRSRHLVAYVTVNEDSAELVEIERADDAEAERRFGTLTAAGATAARQDRADVQSVAEAMDALDQVYLDAVCRALTELGVYRAAGQGYDGDALMTRCRIVPRYRRWLMRALSALVAAGYLERTGDAFTAAAALPVQSRQTLRRAMEPVLRDGSSAADIERLLDAAASLAGLLTEEIHSAEIYAAAETPVVYQKLFPQSNAICESVVRALVASLPAQRSLRVLEVGAGYGFTTGHLLPHLPKERTEYCFTDISEYFLKEARAKFAEYPFITFGRLDVEKSGTAQGYPAHGFDLIVAASVLHATARIDQSLRHLRAMLAPGGLLLMIEESRFFPSFDLGMGLQQGFDRAADCERRPHHALLSRAGWQEVLQDAGFVKSVVLCEPGTRADYLGFDVLLAEGPRSVRRFHWEAVRAYLQRRLPAYMIPASWVVVDALPLTANGKVDRRALSALGGLRATRSGGRVQPRTATEEALAGIWSKVLGRDDVGACDSFYDLGGDSLFATRIITRVRDQLGVDLPLRVLFEAPTVEALAERVDAAMNSVGETTLAEITAELASRRMNPDDLEALRGFLAEAQQPAACSKPALRGISNG